jgi:hypothetical protein
MKRLAKPRAWVPILALTLLALAGCAGVPKAPSCEGPYRSLNPAHYDTVKDSTSADVPIQFPNS